MSPTLKGIIGFIGFFGIILGYVFQADHLSGYLNLAGIIKSGLMVGALAGGIAGYLLYKKGKDQDARFSIYSGMLILGVVLGPLTLSIVNRSFAGPPISTTFELLSLQPVMQSRTGAIKGRKFDTDAYKIKIRRQQQTYEIQLRANLNNYSRDKKSIILNLKKGGLGYKYIDHSPTGTAL